MHDAERKLRMTGSLGHGQASDCSVLLKLQIRFISIAIFPQAKNDWLPAISDYAVKCLVFMP
jgi:hypothetical protein